MNKKTHLTTWKEREGSLSGQSYADYLKSEEWQKIRRLARTREHYQSCWLCGSKDRLEIHHRNYKWLNTKDAMRGLVAMCRTCHEAVHTRARNQNITVAHATNRMRKEYRQGLGLRQGEEQLKLLS